MKKTKNRIVAILLAFLAFAVSLAALDFGKHTDTASALSEDYNGEPDTIYYFFDYYPTTTYSAMVDKYPEYNIVYDRNINTPGTFVDKVNSNYFSGFGARCMVIIDIKQTVPSATILQQLFQGIKSQHTGDDACTTMFITVADNDYYLNAGFTQYVDTLIYTDFGKLEVFLQNTVLCIEEWLDDDISDLCILLDGNMFIDRINNNIFDNDRFLSIFTEILLNRYGYGSLIELCQAKNITILVNTQGNTYIGLGGTGGSQIYEDFDSLLSDMGENNICAIGFWRFNLNFYDLLYNVQTQLGAENLPLYILECDPFEDTGSGLGCIFPSCSVEVENEIFGAIDNWKH